MLLIFLTLLIIIFGAISVYLAEQEHQSANITKLSDAFWWAIVTIATVGYGDYFPVTTVGRSIAILMMLTGIGIFVLLVSTLAQRRLQRVKSGLKSKTEHEPSLLTLEIKTAMKNKIEEIEKLTEEDFNTLIIMMKSLRCSLIEESNILSAQGVVLLIIINLNFAATVVLTFMPISQVDRENESQERNDKQYQIL